MQCSSSTIQLIEFSAVQCSTVHGNRMNQNHPLQSFVDDCWKHTFRPHKELPNITYLVHWRPHSRGLFSLRSDIIVCHTCHVASHLNQTLSHMTQIPCQEIKTWTKLTPPTNVRTRQDTYTMHHPLCTCMHWCTMMLSFSLSLPLYQIQLDWLPLPCIALCRPSQLQVGN